MDEINCAFCDGKGLDPFELLSPLSKCQVCLGKGKVLVEKPVIKCAFCKGTGVYPYGVRITCTVCGGKGVVKISAGGEFASGRKGASKECPDCKGTGRSFESKLPCLTCKGKGVISY